MTENKPIIIDGVDVSECKYYNEDCEDNNVYGCVLCADIYNCYFKQHARKTQECEELKKTINEAEKSKLDLKSFLVGEAVQNEYEQQLDQLKAENNKLKRQYKELGQCAKRLKDYYYKEKETLSNRFLKLKQALAEIKEIAEEAGNTQYLTFPDFNLKQNAKMLMGQFNGYLQQILQKISEVEND